MIVARLSLPGQSAPGPDPLQSVATARTEHIIGQRGARYPARDTPGSSAPPAASRPRATSADRSAALPPGQSWCSARRGDSPVLRNRGPSPPAPPFRLPSTRCSASAASAASASVRLTYLCRSDPDTEFPDLEPCCGRTPTYSRRSYRRVSARLSEELRAVGRSQHVTATVQRTVSQPYIYTLPRLR
jgi:hypothetical protein